MAWQSMEDSSVDLLVIMRTALRTIFAVILQLALHDFRPQHAQQLGRSQGEEKRLNICESVHMYLIEPVDLQDEEGDEETIEDRILPPAVFVSLRRYNRLSLEQRRTQTYERECNDAAHKECDHQTNKVSDADALVAHVVEGLGA
jgi:hypothetical protein